MRVNTSKTSIEKIGASGLHKRVIFRRKFTIEKLAIKEFRIIAGYGGSIPIKFRLPKKRSQNKFLEINITKTINKIRSDKLPQPEEIHDLLLAIILQEKYSRLIIACDLVELFPQFYSYLVDTLIKNSEHIPNRFRAKITQHFTNPTFPIYHPNSWKSYHFPTAKGTVSPMQPSDGMILVIGPRLEGHSVIFLAIQTHLSCRFLLAVDSLGLRRSGFWSCSF